jgi:hypothetical protein
MSGLRSELCMAAATTGSVASVTCGTNTHRLCHARSLRPGDVVVVVVVVVVVAEVGWVVGG